MTARGYPARIIGHGPAPGSGSGVLHLVDATLPPELAEKKLVLEVERLASENHRLATAQIILRRDLVAAQEEVQTVKAHIRSIQTESDIQIRVLLEKIAKMEADDCKNVANMKKELEQAHKEAQRLVVGRQELVDEIEKANKDLNAVKLEVIQLPDVLSVLDSMKEEHHRLRSSFEYEKDFNIKKVEQLQAMERELLGMSREVGRLEEEVSNAENSLETPTPETPIMTVPCSVPLQNLDHSHPAPAIQSNGPYYHPYGVPPVHMGTVPVVGMISPAPAIPTIFGTIAPPAANPTVDETIPPPPGIPSNETIPPPPGIPPDEMIPPPPATPFDEMIPPPPPYDPPASQ